ncbi:uncharacterized protein DUF3842 [Anaerobacterium chartisolvens]|uniref:Uncharacterized protein DUF3842 n=1 Tax=Anaerobacterium chartisolvens TaxID=1297424 RepID=A0A369BI68_9FIRM|nr:DUF3842 family protein [Anaerobacterium chartisolvens]RCX19384.1 uncharacterized protein DUF3842 [Anaerobacterium chartisolvens]
MKIAVIDGQGGGIGRAVVEKIRKVLPPETQVIALGTNAMATMVMLKAGANEGASGENAVIHNSTRADIIIGAVGIIVANSMMGELTPGMARAIAESPARKYLIPLNRCNVEIVGVKSEPLPYYIDEAVSMVKKHILGF